jgi:hypothetical protein
MPFEAIPNYYYNFLQSVNTNMTYARICQVGATLTDNKVTKVCTVITRVEAGSNTSTVNLRVVRGDKMGLKKAAP